MQTTKLFSTIQHNTTCLSRHQGERKGFSSRKPCDPSSNTSQLNLPWTRHVLGTWKSDLCSLSCTTTIYSYYNINNNIPFVYLQKSENSLPVERCRVSHLKLDKNVKSKSFIYCSTCCSSTWPTGRFSGYQFCCGHLKQWVGTAESVRCCIVESTC